MPAPSPTNDEKYPLNAKNFNEELIDTAFWKCKTMEYLAANPPPAASCGISGGKDSDDDNDKWIEAGQSRRCFSCGLLKPVQSYNKNEKRKGVEARCISCVATNPESMDHAMIRK